MAEAKVEGIKPVATPSLSAKQYEIPMVETMNKADGSGTVEVITQVLKVTKAQLIQGISNANRQIQAQQATVAKLQAQLDKINELEG